MNALNAEQQALLTQLILKQGYNPADFTVAIEPIELKLPPDDTQPKGAITITHCNKVSRTYPYTVDHAWLTAFEQDLSQHVMQPH